MSLSKPVLPGANTTAIMLAPNGARLTKSDHSAIPITVDETIEVAAQCQQLGVQALHAHVRDSQHKHVLDAEQYGSLLAKAATRLGQDFPVQITTEAFGHYLPEQQIELVKALKPEFASVALREIWRGPKHDQPITADTEKRAHDFYHWTFKESVGIQHILYGEQDLQLFLDLKQRGIIPAEHNTVLMVIGRYTDALFADVNENALVVDLLAKSGLLWMLCAFGQTETQCLVDTAIAGGGVRIGFENSTQHDDGAVAKDNQERVERLCEQLDAKNIQRYDVSQLRTLLGATDT